MKKLIICLILLITSVGLYSQERVNGRPRYRFNSTSGIINSSSIVYWSYVDKIWNRSNQSPSNDGYFKNLLSISIKTTTVSDVTYNILLLTYNDRYYKRLSSGHIYDSFRIHEKRYCILTDDEAKLLKNPTEDVSNLVIKRWDTFLDKTEEDLIILNLVENKNILSYDTSVLISIKRYKDVVRLDFNFDMFGGHDWDSELKNHYFEIPYSEWKKLSIQNKL